MSPETKSSPHLPPQWAGFLLEADKLLKTRVTLHCLGGFVLTVLYGVPRSTGDVDSIAVIPIERLSELLSVAGSESPLSVKHKLAIQHVTVADVPENYESRLEEVFAGRFSKMQLLVLELHDVVLAKLTRNSVVDQQDVKFLAQKGQLSAEILRARYQVELRPGLPDSRLSWHDQTLELWLSYFGEQGTLAMEF